MALGNFLNQAFSLKPAGSRLGRSKFGIGSFDMEPDFQVPGISEPPALGPSLFNPQGQPNAIQALLKQDPGFREINIAGAPDASTDLSALLKDEDSPAPGRKRRSTLDTIGRIGDVLAIMGDEDPIYSTIKNADEDREIAKVDNELKRKVLEQGLLTGEQKLRAGDLEIRSAETELFSASAQGLKTVYDQFGPEGVRVAWPMLAQQFNIPPDKAAAFGQLLETNPEEAILALSAAGEEAEYGTSVHYLKDKDGNLIPYQVSKSGGKKLIEMPDGTTPVDPIKVVDLGDGQMIVGGKSGRPGKVYPKSGGPDKGERPVVDDNGNIVGYEPIPGSQRDYDRTIDEADRDLDIGAKSDASQNVLNMLDQIDTSVNELDRLGAINDKDTGYLDSAGNWIASTAVGQTAGQLFNTNAQAERDKIRQVAVGIMQAMKQALGLSARDLDTNQDVQRALARIHDPHTRVDVMKSAVATLRREFQQRLARTKRAQNPGKVTPRSGSGGGSSALERALAERRRRQGR